MTSPARETSDRECEWCLDSGWVEDYGRAGTDDTPKPCEHCRAGRNAVVDLPSDREATLYVCPEGGVGHGYAVEQWTCHGDHHAPVEAVPVPFVSAPEAVARERTLARIRATSWEESEYPNGGA